MTTIRAARPSDAAAIAAVQVETWRDTYAGIIPDRSLLEMSHPTHEAFWAHHLRRPPPRDTTLVAVTDDTTIVGFGNGGQNRAPSLAFDGEVFTLYVRPDHQGQGVGRRLMIGLLRALAVSGHRSAVVWVLAANPARFFYQALGGTLVAQRTEPFHGTPLDELAFGWPDLAAIADQGTGGE